MLAPNEGALAVQEHPEELIDQAERDWTQVYGERFEDLPEQLVTAIREAIKEYQGQEQWLRRREVLRDAKLRFYERGDQHIYENRAGFFVQGIAGGVISGAQGQQIQCPNYIDNYNIFGRYLYINESILTQNPPGIDFRPIGASAEDVQAAETGELYRKEFDRSNDVKALQTAIVRMFGLSGRCVTWTRTEANAQKWGNNPDGSPKKREVCTVHGTLESKVSILAHSQDDTPYVVLYDDPDVKDAKRQYPKFAKHIKAGAAALSENAYERYARLGIMQGVRSGAQASESYTHKVTRINCWLRPCAWVGERYEEKLANTEQSDWIDGRVMTVGEKLDQLFPQGCHAVFVGDTYVGSWDESMDDHLAIRLPYSADGMFGVAMMDPMVVVQDNFNDMMNGAREHFDTGWGELWTDADEEEYATITSQQSAPNAIRQKLLKAGSKLQDILFYKPMAELPATFREFLELIQGPLPQFMLACPPALFGAAMEDQKTASGYAQARAQAMGQQGLIWQGIQYLFSRIYYQAAMCAAVNPDHSEEIVVTTDSGTAPLRMERLTKGNFGAYPDEDSSFPESTMAKRATMSSIITMIGPTPLGMQLLSEPENVEQMLILNGFPEIKLPQAEAYRAEMVAIEELLKQAPLPPTQDALIEHAAQSILAQRSGQPPPPDLHPEPSVPVNDWDYHQWAAQCDQSWLNSDACRREQAAGNIEGIANVVARWRANTERAARKAAIAGAVPGLVSQKPNAAAQAMPPIPGAPGSATM